MGGLAAKTQSRPGTAASEASAASFKTRFAPNENPIMPMGEPGSRRSSQRVHFSQVVATTGVIDLPGQTETRAGAGQD